MGDVVVSVLSYRRLSIYVWVVFLIDFGFASVVVVVRDQRAEGRLRLVQQGRVLLFLQATVIVLRNLECRPSVRICGGGPIADGNGTGLGGTTDSRKGAAKTCRTIANGSCRSDPEGMAVIVLGVGVDQERSSLGSTRGCGPSSNAGVYLCRALTGSPLGGSRRLDARSNGAGVPVRDGRVHDDGLWRESEIAT